MLGNFQSSQCVVVLQDHSSTYIRQLAAGPVTGQTLAAGLPFLAGGGVVAADAMAWQCVGRTFGNPRQGVL